MTDSGRAYAEEPVIHITRAEDKAMSMFMAEEQEILIDLSRSFNRNLEKFVNSEMED